MVLAVVAYMAEPVLVPLQVPVRIPGPPLLVAFKPGAQPPASRLVLILLGHGVECRDLARPRHHEITTAIKAAGLMLQPDGRAHLQRIGLRRAVVNGDDHPYADAQRYRDRGASPHLPHIPVAPPGASSLGH
jgi:hypothetical protein